VGLVQRAIEAAGISTITLSVIPDFTASVGAPRVAALQYPLGRPFGEPDDVDQQLAILRAALGALESIKTPGEIADLPFVWPETRRKTHWHPKETAPIVKLLRKKPWLFLRFISGNIPD